MHHPTHRISHTTTFVTLVVEHWLEWEMPLLSEIDLNINCSLNRKGKEMFYLTTHSTHFILRLYGVGHMVKDHSDSERETHCYSFPLAARVLLYAPFHRQDNTYHGLCYPSRGALAGTRNSSMGPPHEGSIWRPIAPWCDRSYHGATSRSSLNRCSATKLCTSPLQLGCPKKNPKLSLV